MKLALYIKACSFDIDGQNESWSRVPKWHSTKHFDRSGVGNLPTLYPRKGFQPERPFWPRHQQSVFSSGQRDAELRPGQPSETLAGVAKIDRARMGLSYLRPEKRRLVGSKGYTSWLHTGQKTAVRQTCLTGQGKLPLSPPGQVVQNRIVLTVKYRVNEIQYPHKLSEFDIQAETYMALRDAGYRVRGEVKALCLDNGEYRRCRLDLVVFDIFDQPVLIIECKDYDNGSYALSEGTRQHRRYHKFGLPVLRIGSLKQIPAVLNVLDQNT